MATLKVPSTACRVVSSPCHTIATPCPNHQQEAFLSGRKTRRSSPNQRTFIPPPGRRRLPCAEAVAVVVLRGVVVGEEQIVGGEAVVVEQAHKRMVRDLRTQQRPPVTALEKRLRPREKSLAVGIITPVSKAKLLRLATGRQILRIMQLQRQPQENRRAMLSQQGRFQVGISYLRSRNPYRLPNHLRRPHPYLDTKQPYHNLR
jgi:hypothetical protein